MFNILKSKAKDHYLSILSGLICSLSFPPSPLPYLIFFGFIPIFLILKNIQSLKIFFKKIYLWGFIFNLITIYWVGGWEAKTDPFLMIGGAALVFFNPLTFFIPFYFFFLTKKHINYKVAIFLLPFYWASYEYLYMITDASFPWLVLGNSLSNFLVFSQIADIIGSLGLTIVILFINALFLIIIDDYIEKKIFNISIALISLIVIFTILFYGFWRVHTYKISDKKITVGVVQPNLDPWEKWENENKFELLKIYLDLSEKAILEDARFIIWPETALNFYLLNGFNNDLVDSIKKFVDSNNVFILTGMPHIEFHVDKNNLPLGVKHNKNFDYYYTTYNAALLFSPNSNEIQKYGKMKLVPFGEKVPFVEYFPELADFVRWEVGLSGWNKWETKTVFKATIDDYELKFNCLICYESVYPFFVADFFKENSLDFLTIITNDSWYGYSSGPFQHRDFAKLRAIENRRAIARCANGGISCYINPFGKIEKQINLFTKNILTFELSLEKEISFFTKYPLLVPAISLSVLFFSMIYIFFIFLIKKILTMKKSPKKNL